ncbi:MAG: hypothetical protein FWH38_02750 [Treponema sp.]|nr:hypothetical protein [Treponema sp.]
MTALFLALSNGFDVDGKRTHLIDEIFTENSPGPESEIPALRENYPPETDGKIRERRGGEGLILGLTHP